MSRECVQEERVTREGRGAGNCGSPGGWEWLAVGPGPSFSLQGEPSCPSYLANRKGFRKAKGTHDEVWGV